MASTILSDNGVSSGSAGIKTSADGTGVLALQTTTAGGAATTAVTIDTSQNVGIGTASPASKLDINTGGSTGTQDLITLSGLDSASTKQTYGVIRMGIESSTAGSEQGNLHLQTVESGTVRDRIFMKGGGEIAFSNGGSERMRILTTGNILSLSGGSTTATGTGIAFPATQSASSDANTLDDYEEGTWTPTVFVGATQQTVGTATGTYVKIGKTVFIAFRCENVTKSGTGDLSVQGLPFAADTSGNQNKYTEFLTRYAGMNTGGWMQGLIAGASSAISFQNLNSTAGYTGPTTDSNLSATYQIYGCSGFYTATA